MGVFGKSQQKSQAWVEAYSCKLMIAKGVRRMEAMCGPDLETQIYLRSM
jgi:hypothetical protein